MCMCVNGLQNGNHYTERAVIVCDCNVSFAYLLLPWRELIILSLILRCGKQVLRCLWAIRVSLLRKLTALNQQTLTLFSKRSELTVLVMKRQHPQFKASHAARWLVLEPGVCRYKRPGKGGGKRRNPACWLRIHGGRPASPRFWSQMR